MTYKPKDQLGPIQTDVPAGEYKYIGYKVLPILLGQLKRTDSYNDLVTAMKPLTAYCLSEPEDLALRFVSITFEHAMKQNIEGSELLFDWKFLLAYITEANKLLYRLHAEYTQHATGAHKGYIYFLLTDRREEPLVKIGWQSTLDNSRTHAIHSHCPYDLIYLGSAMVRNGVTSEKKLHKYLDYYRFNREWFRYTEKVVEVVNFLANRGYYDCKPSSNDSFLEWLRNGCQDNLVGKFEKEEKHWIFLNRENEHVKSMLLKFATTIHADIAARRVQDDLQVYIDQGDRPKHGHERLL